MVPSYGVFMRVIGSWPHPLNEGTLPDDDARSTVWSGERVRAAMAGLRQG